MIRPRTVPVDRSQHESVFGPHSPTHVCRSGTSRVSAKAGFSKESVYPGSMTGVTAGVLFAGCAVNVATALPAASRRSAVPE